VKRPTAGGYLVIKPMALDAAHDLGDNERFGAPTGRNSRIATIGRRFGARDKAGYY